MKILALEFSTRRRSVALLDVGGECVEVCDEGGSSGRGLFMIERALAQAAWRKEDVECVAVGLGPGSYTGIRVALSLAQGWQLARHTRMVGISSVECLAAAQWKAGMRGHVAIAVDAQRNEYYVAEYESGPEKWMENTPLRLVSRHELEDLGNKGAILGGPDLRSILPSGQDLYPSAAVLADLVSRSPKSEEGHRIEPIYLRPVSFVKAPTPRVIPDR